MPKWGEASIDRWTPSDRRDPRTRSARIDKPFLMPVEDVFTITGRGTVVTGRIERGVVKVNDAVEIVGIPRTTRPPSPVSRCSASCSTGPGGRQRRSAACVASSARDVERGQVVDQAGHHHPHTEFEAASTSVQGRGAGRHAVLQQLPSQFYFRTTDVTGVWSTAPEGTGWSCPAARERRPSVSTGAALVSVTRGRPHQPASAHKPIAPSSERSSNEPPPPQPQRCFPASPGLFRSAVLGQRTLLTVTG